MKTEIELEKEILKLTMKIREKYPELSKYLTEMPVKYVDADKKEIKNKSLEDYKNSLEELITRFEKELEVKKKRKTIKQKEKVTSPFENSESLSSEDVYKQWKEESDVDPEDITKKKTANEKPGVRNEKDFSEDKSGSDLDVPGSELDDQQESVGSEDEENNYYSLGGDNHNDLDEDKG